MIQLYDHNQTAYRSALNLLAETGKAAVVHPTGTGKSFIAFKLIEDNPDKSFVWLSPSEKIYSTQLDNVKKAAGFSPKNVTFFTYARLTNMDEPDLQTLCPDFIILDEFHRAGAPEWGKSVRKLISCFPEAKLLGLSATNIRYLDDQRDMADELFDNCIADQMTLTEAVTKGILPAPKYVISVYTYQLEEENYRKRMNHLSLPARKKAEEYLQKLRHAIEKAEGLEDIFPRHMQNPHGKYIVFCANYNHMQEMMQKSRNWFRKVDEHPHYYSVWADSPNAERDYRTFQEDNSDHLRLLFCIDMFNEGIHVEDISGVILFRPTISPIIYKQQIGRALSALQTSNNQPVIFDIVNNFENLQTLSSVKDDLRGFITLQTEEIETENETVSPFQIIDEVRECRELFRKLEETLTLSWDMMYQEAKAYYNRNGHLQIPKNYRTADGYPLGSWLLTQRRIRRGSYNGLLTEERIHLLDQIGMNWSTRSETAWETGVRHAKEYKEQFGNLDVTARYVSPDGYCLGKWICYARQKYDKARNRGKEASDIPELKQLSDLGIIWEKGSESFERGLQAAKDYIAKNGNLDVASRYITADGFRLGQWLDSQRTRKKRNAESKRTDKELTQLDALGMRWDAKPDLIWERNYQRAKQFFEINHHLTPSCNYTVERFNLGKWIGRQREMYRDGKLNTDQVKRLEAIGMKWISPNSWGHYYRAAEQYFKTHGNLEVSPNYVSPEGIWLGTWIAEQRLARNQGAMPEEHVKKLNNLSMRWMTRYDQRWEKTFLDLTKWISDHEQMTFMPTDTKTEDGTNLYLWTKRQWSKSVKGDLLPHQQLLWSAFIKDLYYQRMALGKNETKKNVSVDS